FSLNSFMKFYPGQLGIAGSLNSIIGSLDILRNNKLGHETQRFTAEWVFEESIKVDVETYRRIIPGNIFQMNMHGISNQMKDMANLVHPKKELREHARKRILQCVEAAGELDVRHLVFHQWYAPERIKGFTEKIWYAQADYWPEIAQEARKHGVIIVLENDHTPTPEHAMKLLDKISHENVQGHIDITHAQFYSRSSPQEWIKVMGDRLHYLHINNGENANSGHQPLNRGIVDYKKIFPLLEPVWNQIMVTLEIDAGDREGVKASLKVLKGLGLLPVEENMDNLL
ncbi:MAG: sugar phosphate isomerase/epimerase family protein, partial [bacterium]